MKTFKYLSNDRTLGATMVKIIMFASLELTDIFRKYLLRPLFTGHGSWCRNCQQVFKWFFHLSKYSCVDADKAVIIYLSGFLYDACICCSAVSPVPCTCLQQYRNFLHGKHLGITDKQSLDLCPSLPWVWTTSPVQQEPLCNRAWSNLPLQETSSPQILHWH